MALATPSPTPFTRRSSPSEPKGPSESRSATIRCASAGPTFGSDTISHSCARSMSTGPPGVAPRSRVAAPAGDESFVRFLRFDPPLESARTEASDPSDVETPNDFGRFDLWCLPPPACSTESAESTDTIWRCRSARAAALGGGGSALRAFVARTPAPKVSMAERKTRARFSAGVGMREDRAGARRDAHSSTASGHHTQRCPAMLRESYFDVTSAVATSPTTCREWAEILSKVSCGVWCSG